MRSPFGSCHEGLVHDGDRLGLCALRVVPRILIACPVAGTVAEWPG